ncbi:MAG: hypothetical protein O7B99_12735, partial [Planctomycetota bacterium]|nr:hypothetical protein [Planctomycetota bacterium]
KGGRQARGVLISDDGISIQLRAQNGNVRTYAYGALDPRSIYRLMKAKTRPDDGSGRLVLANYARDNGLYAHARRHYKEALKADGSQVTAIEASLTTLRSLASNELLTEGREKLEKGDHRGAEKDLTAVINEFPLERAAETAAGLLADIDARQQEEYTRSVRDRSEAVAKALAGARKDYDKMVEKNREGLMNVRSQTRAIRSYKSAIKDGEKALKKIASVRKKNGDEPQYAAACEELDALVIEQVVQTSINLASAEMVRSSYNNALKSINVALGHAPKHAEAKAMRARIEDAAAESSGWGWGWRLGRAGGIR